MGDKMADMAYLDIHICRLAKMSCVFHHRVGLEVVYNL